MPVCVADSPAKKMASIIRFFRWPALNQEVRPRIAYFDKELFISAAESIVELLRIVTLVLSYESDSYSSIAYPNASIASSLSATFTTIRRVLVPLLIQLSAYICISSPFHHSPFRFLFSCTLYAVESVCMCVYVLATGHGSACEVMPKRARTESGGESRRRVVFQRGSSCGRAFSRCTRTGRAALAVCGNFRTRPNRNGVQVRGRMIKEKREESMRWKREWLLVFLILAYTSVAFFF